MENDRSLPSIESPEAAKQKMMDSYHSFVDSAAKFLSLADFYGEKENEGKAVPVTFQDAYSKNYQKLLSSNPDDFSYLLSRYAALDLDFLSDVEENLSQFDALKAGQDPSLSDYDKSCDLLAVRDTFVDLEKALNEANRAIATERELDSNFGDPAYDPSAAQQQKENGAEEAPSEYKAE